MVKAQWHCFAISTERWCIPIECLYYKVWLHWSIQDLLYQAPPPPHFCHPNSTLSFPGHRSAPARSTPRSRSTPPCCHCWRTLLQHKNLCLWGMIQQSSTSLVKPPHTVVHKYIDIRCYHFSFGKNTFNTLKVCSHFQVYS